ncbi:hypothetical protein FRY74_12680, partial [Vicingus serpentipes]
MKKLIISVIFLLINYYSFACDSGSFTIVSQTTNPDGTITYVLNIQIELGSGDGFYEGFQLTFNSPSTSPTVTIFDNALTAADLTSGNITETLDGSASGNVLDYINNTPYSAASNDFGLLLSVTVDGCAESIDLLAHYTFPGSCTYNAVTGQNCATCSITALAAGTQTACNPATNTYTQQVVVTYSNEPGAGTLDVNGQSFAITGSPQTVTLTNLPADGNNVNVTAVFSADATCLFSTNSLFTAPAPCPPACTISVAAG